MKKIFFSYSYNDKYALEIISFLKSHLSPYDYEVKNIEEQVYSGENIRQAISESINKCSIFICFVEQQNPNVMFELGYALGKNKKIVIVGDPQKIPYDVRGMAYMQKGSNPYEILSFLEKELNVQENIPPFHNFDPTHLQSNLKALVENPDLLDSLDGKEFEKLVWQWFEYKGYQQDSMSYTRDYGFDFLISHFDGVNAIVEVKKYKATSKVPVSIVRQLVGAMALEKVPVGIIVSSAPFTNSAKYFAEELEQKIFLWTINDLIRLTEIPNDAISSDS